MIYERRRIFLPGLGARPEPEPPGEPEVLHLAGPGHPLHRLHLRLPLPRPLRAGPSHFHAHAQGVVSFK